MTIQQLQQEIAVLNTNCKKSICAANTELLEIQSKVNYFNTKLDQCIESANTRVSTTVAMHQNRFQAYITSHTENFQETIDKTIAAAVQAANDE